MEQSNIILNNSETPTSIYIKKCFAGANINATIVNIIEEKLIVTTANSLTKEKYTFRWWRVPTQRTSLIDRTLHTNNVIHHLQSASKDAPRGISPVVLYGMAGTGKTTIALEVVYQQIETYQNIFWFNAASPQELRADFIKLAHALDLVYATDDEAIFLLKGWVKDNPKSLLIFDGALDYRSIEKYLPAVNVNILITSQCSAWSDDKHVIKIPVFNNAESRELIKKTLGKGFKASKKDRQELINVFGNHPLGLSQALSYMQVNVITIQRFLTLLKRHPQHVMTGGIRQTLPLHYQGNPLYSLWDNVLAFIEKEENAFKLLNLLCWFAEDNIHVKALPEVLSGSNYIVCIEAVGLLVTHSLAKKDIATNTILLHGLLQTVLWHKQNDAEKIRAISWLAQFFSEQLVNDRFYLIHHAKAFWHKADGWLKNLLEEEKIQVYGGDEQLKNRLSIIQRFIEEIKENEQIIIEDSSLQQPIPLTRIEHSAEIKTEVKENNLDTVVPLLQPHRRSEKIIIKNNRAQEDIEVTAINQLDQIIITKTEDEIRAEKLRYATNLWNVPANNPNFTGREPFLDQVQTLLETVKKDSYTPIVITAFHGLGGVGKTEIVKEFIYRHHKEYENVFWFPAENTIQIRLSYIELAKHLSIATEEDSQDEIIEKMRQWFIHHPNNLLVFDDAGEHAEINDYLPQTGNAVLITSRENRWPGYAINVGVFIPDEAYDFVIKIIGDHHYNTKEMIDELTEELGYLPLAIAQAAAYIRQNRMQVSEYTQHYREQKTYFLNKKSLPVGQDHAAVFVTWNVTLSKIEEKYRSVLPKNILTACAYLFKEKIPETILRSISTKDKHNPHKELIEEALGLLHSYSMLVIDPQERSICVHKLVQEVILNKCSSEEQSYWLELLASSYLHFYQIDISKSLVKSNSVGTTLNIILHLKKIIELADSMNKVSNKIVQAMFLIRPLTSSVFVGFSIAESMALDEELQLISKLTNNEDKMRYEAFTREALGACLVSIDPKGAVAQLTTAFEIRKKLYNQNSMHPEFLSSRYSLAAGKIALCEYDNAEKLLTSILNEYVELQTFSLLESSIIQSCLEALSNIYQQSGRLKKLLKIQHKIIPLFKNVLKSFTHDMQLMRSGYPLDQINFINQNIDETGTFVFFYRLFPIYRTFSLYLGCMQQMHGTQSNIMNINTLIGIDTTIEEDQSNLELSQQAMMESMQGMKAIIEMEIAQQENDDFQEIPSAVSKHRGQILNGMNQMMNLILPMLSSINEPETMDIPVNNFLEQTDILSGLLDSMTQGIPELLKHAGVQIPVDQMMLMQAINDVVREEMGSLLKNLDLDTYNEENLSISGFDEAEKISRELFPFRDIAISALSDLLMEWKNISNNISDSFCIETQSKIGVVLETPLKQLVLQLNGKIHHTAFYLRALKNCNPIQHAQIVNAVKQWENGIATYILMLENKQKASIEKFLQAFNQSYLQGSSLEDLVDIVFFKNIIPRFSRLIDALKKVETGYKIINHVILNSPTLIQLREFYNENNLDFNDKKTSNMPDRDIALQFNMSLNNVINTVQVLTQIYQQTDIVVLKSLCLSSISVLLSINETFSQLNLNNINHPFALLLFIFTNKSQDEAGYKAFIKSINSTKQCIAKLELGSLAMQTVLSEIEEDVLVQLLDEENLDKSLRINEQVTQLKYVAQLVSELRDNFDTVCYLLQQFPKNEQLKIFLEYREKNKISHREFLKKTGVLSMEEEHELAHAASNKVSYFLSLAFYHDLLAKKSDTINPVEKKRIAECLFKLLIEVHPSPIIMSLYSNFLYKEQRYEEALYCASAVEWLSKTGTHASTDNLYELVNMEQYFLGESKDYLINKKVAKVSAQVLAHYIAVLSQFNIKNKIPKQLFINFSKVVEKDENFASYYFLASCCKILKLSKQAIDAETKGLIAFKKIKNNPLLNCGLFNKERLKEQNFYENVLNSSYADFVDKKSLNSSSSVLPIQGFFSTVTTALEANRKKYFKIQSQQMKNISNEENIHCIGQYKK